MAAGKVYSYQLRYNLLQINKSVMRLLHVINLSERSPYIYSFVTFIVRCDVYSSGFLSLQVLDMFRKQYPMLQLWSIAF